MKDSEKGEYVQRLVSEAIAIGVAIANRAYEPQEDKLKSKNIAIWTKNIGITPDVIRALVKKNKLAEHRVTVSPNSARYFSFVEIKQALLAEGIRTGFGGKFPTMMFHTQM